ncbi:NAD(P)H-hydrate dehydratase [uncultured Solobacterium sp.]|uniref:NAD(P)H-hydrate dehydratase n=1 Tax=uncultured Solobacterium sp. TaxID=747375 RepID=UPI0028D38187|nr:NAD(P)H-hydrate dehydratase [uncultured Solobacterium sp.]
MIVSRKEMLEIEEKSGLSSFDLINLVGKKLAVHLLPYLDVKSNILVLAGNGNNGADCFALINNLKQFHIKLILVNGLPNNPDVMKIYQQVSPSIIQPLTALDTCLKECDVIIDGIFGFGYHGKLSEDKRVVFKQIQNANKPIYSIDINSGAECDSAMHDSFALHSTVTFAIDCYKPFHILQKYHHLFDKLELISLDIPHPKQSSFLEMNQTLFFQNLAKRKETAHKGSNGKILLVGGSYGMAGAISLNITGAKALGFPYIEVGCIDGIYPIVATKHTTPVFHPFSRDNVEQQLASTIEHVNAAAFGSGVTQMYEKELCLDLMIQKCHAPLVLDAEGIRMLRYNTWKLRFAKSPIILTPHIGEFADLFHLEKEEVMRNPLYYALKCAKELKVYIVLKSAHTIIATPNGQCYINQTGNEALAQAGSGDLLTGMLTALLAYHCDIFTSLRMGVWLHGYIADRLVEHHSKMHMNLEDYPTAVDQFFYENGY